MYFQLKVLTYKDLILSYTGNVFDVLSDVSEFTRQVKSLHRKVTADFKSSWSGRAAVYVRNMMHHVRTVSAGAVMSV